MATSGVPPVLTHAAGLPSTCPPITVHGPQRPEADWTEKPSLALACRANTATWPSGHAAAAGELRTPVAPAGDAPHVQAPVAGFCVASASFPCAVTATSVTPPAPVTTAGVPVRPPGPVPAADHELHPEVPSVARSSAPDPVTQNTSSVRPPATTGTGAPAQSPPIGAHAVHEVFAPGADCRVVRTCPLAVAANTVTSPSGAWTAPGSLTGFPAFPPPTGPPHCQSFGAPGCCQACTICPAVVRANRVSAPPGLAATAGLPASRAGELPTARVPHQAALPIGCW